MRYIALLRGINVGGKNKISMSELKQYLAAVGFTNVSSYINSGNILFDSDEKRTKVVEDKIEQLISSKFKIDSESIKILALTGNQLKAIVKQAPPGFGQYPDKYYSDVLFLMDVTPADVMKVIETNPEVDAVWQGRAVVYYRRLAAKRVKSRLPKIASQPIYKNITIRSWNTTRRLLILMFND